MEKARLVGPICKATRSDSCRKFSPAESTRRSASAVSPYPKEWHVEVGAALRANYMRRAIVCGIGEYSADGKLQRIREIKSFDIFRIPDWKEALLRRGRITTLPVRAGANNYSPLRLCNIWWDVPPLVGRWFGWFADFGFGGSGCRRYGQRAWLRIDLLGLRVLTVRFGMNHPRAAVVRPAVLVYAVPGILPAFAIASGAMGSDVLSATGASATMYGSSGWP